MPSPSTIRPEPQPTAAPRGRSDSLRSSWEAAFEEIERQNRDKEKAIKESEKERKKASLFVCMYLSRF